MNKKSNPVVKIIAPIVTLAVLFSLWEIACRVRNVPTWFLPKPSEIFRAMVVKFPDFWPHIRITFVVILVGFLIAIPVGLILASIVTSFKTASAALGPYITFLVTTPLISLIPLLMLVLGFGLRLRIVTVVIQSFAVINMNACTGFNNIPTLRHELMQSIGASPMKTYLKMRVPSAATDIFTGLRLAAIFATTACISVEYNAGNTGLGSQIIRYSQYMQVAESFACIFYVMLIGLLMYGLISLAQRKIINWKE